MAQFRKKPVVIEAQQLVGNSGECMQVCEWIVANGYPWLCGNALEPETLRYEDGSEPTNGIWIEPATGALMIRTLEGDMRADYEDWIIRGVKGEFYPCKPDIFEATYEPAEVPA
jgi:hypothetical protein